MLKNFNTLTVVMAVLLVLSLTHTAPAVIIQANGNTVFEDDFENATPGSGNSPSPTTGNWTINSNTTNYPTDAVSPGPAQGNNYFRVARPSEGNSSANFLGGVVQSGTVTGSWMLNLPGDAPDFASNILFFEQVSNQNQFPTGSIANLATVNANNDGAADLRLFLGVTGGNNDFVFLTDAIQTDTWQRWDVTIDVDNETYTLSIGGTQHGPYDWIDVDGVVQSNGPGAFNFRGGSNGAQWYIDAVPEPSAVMLLGMGLVGLFGFSRSSRRRA